MWERLGPPEHRARPARKALGELCFYRWAWAGLTTRLVVSEHTEETLSQKEWEERLLAVRMTAGAGWGGARPWPVLGVEASPAWVRTAQGAQ